MKKDSFQIHCQRVQKRTSFGTKMTGFCTLLFKYHWSQYKTTGSPIWII